jgi:imidazolonepropionase-like amidohydrolase
MRSTSKRKALLIKGATIVDARSEYQADVLVEDGTIKQIGDVDANSPVEIINASALYLTPGLIDCHVHLILNGSPNIVDYVQTKSDSELTAIATANAIRTLQNGVTTVRDMGGKNFIELKVRDAVNSSAIPGPRILASGKMITSIGGHVRYIGREAHGAEDCRRAVREQIENGADFIKVMATGGLLTEDVEHEDIELTAEELAAAVDEAKKYEMKSAAHAHGLAGIKNAINAGVDSIEHGSFANKEAIERMTASGIFWVPTVKSLRDILDDEIGSNLSKDCRQRARSSLNAVRKALKYCTKNTKITCGTDAGTPYNYHGDNSIELELLVEYGLDVHQAFESATTTAANLLGLGSRIGLVREGYDADLLLLRKNPLDDIRSFRKSLVEVIRSGSPLLKNKIY